MARPETGQSSHGREVALVERLLPVGGVALMVTGLAELGQQHQVGETVSYAGAILCGATMAGSLVADVMHNRRLAQQTEAQRSN